MSSCLNNGRDQCCANGVPVGGCEATGPAPGPAAPPKHFEYTMVGVKVLFPVKPYPSQMAIMAQILRGLQKDKHNCLLESPTGSGKSLALLCSTIAWQQQHNARVQQYNSLVDQGIYDTELLARLTGLKLSSTPTPQTHYIQPTPTFPTLNHHTPHPNTSLNNNTPPVVKTELEAKPSVTNIIKLESEVDSKLDLSNIKREFAVPKVENDSKTGIVKVQPEYDDDFDFKKVKPKVENESSIINTSAGLQSDADSTRQALGALANDSTIFGESFLDQTQEAAAAAGSDEGIMPGGFLKDGEDGRSAATPGMDAMPPTMGGAPYMQGEHLGDQEPPRPKRMRSSKIFFGSRTHKQIAQVVKELKRTAYAGVRSAVLGSREHYCIHPVVSRQSNKNEGCQKQRDGKTGSNCRFHLNASRVKNHDQLHSLVGVSGVHDLEELVMAGRRSQSCPYYLAKAISDTADIVFCPYNYLIDPLIRDAMSISLNHHVVVLDEAHNMEDCSREAASCSLNADDIGDAKEDIDKLKEFRQDCDTECAALSMFLSILSDWMARTARGLEDSFEATRSTKIITGTQMIATLDHLEIGRQQWKEIQRCLGTLNDDLPGDEEDKPKPKMSSVVVLKNIFLMLHYLYSRPLADADDYRVGVARAQSKRQPRPSPNKGGWMHKRRPQVSWATFLNFMCLNPGVAFQDVGKTARNVILTSGTLCPMSSFQSELAIPFQIQLEANHVIDKKQVWIGTVSQGPTNMPLTATYQHTNTQQFQDELGRLILSVCRAVPRGVLCFLPSYSLLDKLSARWEQTGLINALSQIKEVMLEPRRSEEFETVIQTFYDTIKRTSSNQSCSEGVNGAFLLAVCRGKVSEGLDFTDDNARAVIAVGIPFPNVKDTQVALKRKYNDQHCRTRGLLSGGAWYEVQAYRALNQALGRCLRHRYDWGAILLVDERFQHGATFGNADGYLSKYIKGLSKWVRNMVSHQPNFAEALRNIEAFAEDMTKNPPHALNSVSAVKSAVQVSTPAASTPAKPAVPLAPVFTMWKTPTNNTKKGGNSSRSSSSLKNTTDEKSSAVTLVEETLYNLRSGPMTSTQMSTRGSAVEHESSQSLVFPLLSQINSSAEDNADANLTDDASFAGRNEELAASKPFVSSLHLHRKFSGSNEDDLKFLSPSSKLAKMVPVKLKVCSPATSSSSVGSLECSSQNSIDKRKLEPSPDKAAKKHCPSVVSSPRPFKFTSADTIIKLSPKKDENMNSNNSGYLNSTQENRNNSPDLFGSDDDCPSDINSTVGVARVSLKSLPVLPPQPGPAYDEDSDFDDFDMNKSIRSSPEIKRRVSRILPRKGVRYSKWKK